MLPVETIAFMVTGAALAGFVMGLVGFGTGLAALGFWLHVVDPKLAVPLVAICSLATTGFTLGAYRHAISMKRMAPFFLGAVIGLPIGIVLLTRLDPDHFRLAMGGFLIVYTIFRLLVLPSLVLTSAGRPADLAVGTGGGVLAGLAGIPGPLTTVWCGLRGWTKDEQRAVYQPFNQAMILIAFIAYAFGGLVTKELGYLALYCLPATLIGMVIGMAGYKRLNEQQFQRVVLIMLLLSGITLIFNR